MNLIFSCSVFSSEQTYARVGPTLQQRRLSLKKAAWPLKMWPTGCPETSVINYQSTLRHIPEERIYHLHHGGSLESQIVLKPLNTLK
jgi:hypothetical protein